MNVVVSGGNGFIGSALVKRLQKDYDVIKVSSDDVHNQYALRDIFDAFDPKFIFHLAAYGNHYNQTDEEETIFANVLGTYNMLYSSKNTNYDMFYNFSSSSVTLNTDTFYSATKLCAEHVCNAFAIKYNKPIRNIRPYSVYGEGEASFRFIPTVISKLHNGEEMMLDEYATHDWIYIEDFIDALLNGYTEIGTGIKTTNIEIVRILEDISGKKLKYRPSKLRSYDNKDWVAKEGVKHISLQEGLLKTYKHYAKRRP